MEKEFLGLLKPEEEKDCGKVIDEVVDFKKVFPKRKLLAMGIESLDGKFFTLTVRELDDRLADKIPPDYKPEARKVLLGIINRDWDLVAEATPVLLNKPIDIPGIDEDVELAILAGITQAIYLAARAYAAKQKKA